MTVQANIITHPIHDDPKYCNNPIRECAYLLDDRCALRPQNPKLVLKGKFLKLESEQPGIYIKCENCRFIWKKNKHSTVAKLEAVELFSMTN